MTTFEEFKEMADYAHRLCNQVLVSNPSAVADRNKKIISDIMSRYGIEESLANDIFMNNNDLSGLMESYNMNFTSDGVRKHTI